LLKIWSWTRDFEELIDLIWRILEAVFGTVQKRKSRKYASPSAERLFGYPALAFTPRTAPDWTVYGRGEGAKRITTWHLAGVNSGQQGAV
jgi:hypothetical protein